MNEEQIAALLGVLAIAGVITVFLLIFTVFYCLSLSKALKRVSPENRAMEPGLVWLLLIPCVSLIFHFFVVINVSKSLGRELRSRGIPSEDEPGKPVGLAACILPICGFIPFIGGLFGLAGLVCQIVYWVKVVESSKKLA